MDVCTAPARFPPESSGLGNRRRLNLLFLVWGREDDTQSLSFAPLTTFGKQRLRDFTIQHQGVTKSLNAPAFW